MNFKKRLREEIEYNGLLIKELADKAGISKKTLDMYVAGRGSMPPADKAVRLSKVLGVSVEYLVTGELKVDPALPKEIRDLIEYFSQLNDEEKTIILQLTRSLYNRKNM